MSPKLADTLIICTSGAFFMVGIYELIYRDLYTNYYIFMVAIGTLLWYMYRRGKRVQERENDRPTRKK